MPAPVPGLPGLPSASRRRGIYRIVNQYKAVHSWQSACIYGTAGLRVRCNDRRTTGRCLQRHWP